MMISFNPLDPREVADTINLLRVLGAIDAAVSVEVNGEPTLTEAEARRRQLLVTERCRMWREEPRPQQQPRVAPTSPLPVLDLGDL